MTPEYALGMRTGGVEELFTFRLRKWMAHERVSQTRLGSLLGLSQDAISDRMRGRTSWSLAEIDRLEELMKISLLDVTDFVADFRFNVNAA